ncbi:MULTISPECIES: ATP-binding protein [Roseomonadaceae]|uniref:histidine kinase n=1 Tax=Falsiroseomonas oleicola TaxID=2801474 RepID=A0ABS6HAJ9_9PROT|nr:ATP-binding protein [Roseomonas oleicola]MBU8545703.1 response regulator [Roseomonas oleicola]
MRLLLALTVVLPLLALVAFAIDQRAQLWQDARRDTEGTLSILYRNMQTLLETHELVLDLVEDQIRDMTDAEIAEGAVSQRLATLVQRLQHTVSLLVQDAEGKVLAASRPFVPGHSNADMDHFIAQVDAPQVHFISDVYTGRVSGARSFAISRRRSLADGSFAGTIHVAISPIAVAQGFRAAMGNLGGVALLVRDDGRVLVRESANADAALASMETAAEYGWMRLDAWRQVAPFPLRVGYFVDLPARKAACWRQLLWTAALTLLVILLLSGAAWMTWRSATDRAEALAELRQEAERRHRAEAGLQEARAMEALGRMARGVAHDFNNLLTVVLGNLETLEESLTDPVLRGMAQRTIGAAEASARLAASLMAYARTQVLRVEAVDAAALMHDLLPVLRDLASPSITLRLEAEPGLPPCLADPAQLQAAVGNLVSNARDAILQTAGLQTAGERRMPGHILISIRRATPPPGAAKLAAGCIGLSVSDNGGGMAPNVLKHAFEPFFTTKPAGSGSGLGLSQVFGVITQLGGTVALHSEAGEGSAVTLYLPMAGTAEAPLPAEAQAAEIQAPEPAPEPAPSARILVVDDQAEIRTMISRMLTMAGYQVVTAAGGREALARMEAEPRFALVLSDVLMPEDIGGVELAGRIRAGWPGTPVLLMSGYTPDVVGTEAAADGFLHKPFTRQALQAEVRQLLARAAGGGRPDDPLNPG